MSLLRDVAAGILECERVCQGLDEGRHLTGIRYIIAHWPFKPIGCKLDIRKYAFSQRTINEWNRLPGECVHATSVNMFKNKIDNYFKRSGYV